MGGPAPRTRILIADADALVRHALRAELLAADDLDVVGDMSTSGDVVAAVADAVADVVVVEPHVDGRTRLDLVDGIMGLGHCPDVVAFSAVRDLPAEIAALTAGARGFLLKEDGIDAVPDAVRTVARGEVAISRRLTLDIIEHLRTAPLGDEGMRPVRSKLTAREWEVLDLMSRSHSTQAIAEAMVVSTDTVYSHVKNVMRKLGVHSRAEAIAVARAGFPESAER